MTQKLFDALFNMEAGYINKDNILSLNDADFTENFDKNKLAYILNNLGKIESLYREDARNQTSLSKYYNKSSKSVINVKYVQNDNGLYGRYQAIGSLSGQGMIREARHTIFNELYVDIDMDNCHPVITKWLCDNLNIDCPMLNEYVFNREKHLAILMKLNSWTRDQVKKHFLCINYGCGDALYNKMVNKSDFIMSYRKEMEVIQKKVSEILYEFKNINSNIRKEKGKSGNLYGSTLSHICQFVENQLLMIIIDYLQNDKKLDINDSILCFDGMMINKKKFDGIFLYEIEKKFQSVGINMKMSTKSMDLDEYILKLCKYKKDNKYYYPYEKRQFDFDDNYFYMDFIKDLAYKNGDYVKIWDSFDHLCKFASLNVNRVMFRMLSQKNQYFGRYNMKAIAPIELTNHLLKFYNEKGEIEDVRVSKLINGVIYNDVKEYNFLEFKPFTRDCAIEDEDDRDFNLFQGFQAKLYEKEDVDLDIIKPVLNHWLEVLANENDTNFHYQLSYFHKIFKFPNQKTKAIMLFKSDQQQIGKGILLNTLIGELIFGTKLYQPKVGLSFITDRFNEEQGSCLFTVVEELSTVDDSYNNTFDILKSRAVDPFVNIEPKFGKKYNLQNHNNFIMNTNNKFPVKIEAGDARFATFECNEKYHKNFDYFDRLAKSINQNVADHLYSYIYHLDNPVDPRDTPKNDFYNDIKFNSLNSSVRFLSHVKDLLHNDTSLEDHEDDSWERMCLIYTEKYDTEKLKVVDEAEEGENVINIMKASNMNTTYKAWCRSSTEKNTSMSRFKSYTENYIGHGKSSKYNYYNLDSIDLSSVGK